MKYENLERLYKNIFDKAKNEIFNDNYFIDELIDSPTDKRFGISLIMRPNEKVKLKIENVLSKIFQIEPEQYYYPKSDLHLTVLSIISCYSGFNLSKISIDEYSAIVTKSLRSIENFDIVFSGITLTNSGILIKGFPSDNSLNLLRENLRNNFKNVNLQQSIDARYSITTAHITALRFRKKLKEKERFLNLIEQYKYYHFGNSKIVNFELVYNDWYQKVTKVKILNIFKI